MLLMICNRKAVVEAVAGLLLDVSVGKTYKYRPVSVWQNLKKRMAIESGNRLVTALAEEVLICPLNLLPACRGSNAN